jgi:arylsulfatase A-like enzyme
LKRAGYQTAFFQSADGVFEARPRLVNKLGYQTFRAWEDIRGEVLGYFSSDDRSLKNPVQDWITQQVKDGQPFMATVLTSATHHPYSKGLGLVKGWKYPKPRYKKLIKESDALLADLLNVLKDNHIYNNTIVIVLGDHGEGFNEHGILQHDNNFYEEALKVPFVMRGPGVRPHQEYGNTTLMDLPPSLLFGVLGLRPAAINPFEGNNFLSAQYDFEAKKYFGCFSHLRCRGYIQGNRKFLHLPNDNIRGYLDLSEDSTEKQLVNIDKNSQYWKDQQALDQFIYTKLTADEVFPLRFYRISYGMWFCAKDKMLCYHARAKDRKYRFAETKLRYDDDGNLIKQKK